MKVLDKILSINKRIKYDYETLEELSNKIIGVSSVKYGDKIQSSNIYSFDNLLIKKFELEKEILEKEIELGNLKLKVQKTLLGMRKPRPAVILHMKYIEFKTLEEISEELKISPSYIEKILDGIEEEFYSLYEK